MIAIPSITAAVERNKEKALAKKINIIEASAETYASMNKNNIEYTRFTSKSCCINIEHIKEKGFLKESDLIDSDNNPIIGYICYENKEYLYYETNPLGTTTNKTCASAN